jgi:hypothetical protein
VWVDFLRRGYDWWEAVAAQQHPAIPERSKSALIFEVDERNKLGANVGARAQNRIDVTRTYALVSQPETGKISCVRLPYCDRLPPGAC